MKKLLLFLFLSIFLSINAFSQEKQYQLPEVVVTAGRTPVLLSDLNRDVKVIGPQMLKTLPVNSVQDVLQFVDGVDMQTRGIGDVQSDVSIRGGSFEETLVLIDGVKMSDPQTGHHNLNLPIALDDVQRIEVLEGQGSRIYGPNAFSGIINIITKKGRDKDFSLNLSGGQNSYYNAGLYFALPLAFLNNHFSFKREKSNGYRHNTDFDELTFSYNSSVVFNSGSINMLYGYNNKKFGANSFYSVLYPDQWEHTKTQLLNLNGDFGFDNITLSPKIYWRRNNDDYILERYNPSVYENVHQTNVYGGELQLSMKSDFGTTSLGGEFSQDKIQSTNLGNHQRNKKGFFFEENFSPIGKFNIVPGAFLYDYASLGWKFWPGLDLGYQLTKSLRLYGSVGKAFRVPTYTELYYTSPTQIGNPNLHSEETTNYEVGFKYVRPEYNFKLSLFRKDGKNLIDWVKNNTEDSLWKAENISKINTDGFDIDFSFNPKALIKQVPFTQFDIGYTYLNEDKNTNYSVSVYLLNYLRHQLNINLVNYWWFDIVESWHFTYEDRVNYKDYILIDTQISKDIQHVRFYFKLTNLFNTGYEEVSGVPMPGRWIYGGIKLNI